VLLLLQRTAPQTDCPMLVPAWLRPWVMALQHAASDVSWEAPQLCRHRVLQDFTYTGGSRVPSMAA
jgi:hypothetical protein